MKTKLLLLLFAVFLLGSTVRSQEQEDEEMKLLFKPKHEKQSNGGYGAFQFGWTQVNGQSAITVGGRGAWVANHYFALGLAGNGFYSNTNDFPNNTNHTYALYGGYGGILIEPIVASMSTFHVSFPMIFGGGGVVASSWDTYYPSGSFASGSTVYYGFEDGMSPFFIFQPGIEFEINIVRSFKLALGISYKLTTDINIQIVDFDDSYEQQLITIDKKAIDGLMATLTFKFGKF